MLRHNRDLETVATERNPPRGKKNILHKVVQNVQNDGGPLRGSGTREKLKVKAIKEGRGMFRDTLKARSGCLKRRK